jgi:hypothetical protein
LIRGKEKKIHHEGTKHTKKNATFDNDFIAAHPRTTGCQARRLTCTGREFVGNKRCFFNYSPLPFFVFFVPSWWIFDLPVPASAS